MPTINDLEQFQYWTQRLGLTTHFGRFLGLSAVLWALLFTLVEPSSSMGLGWLKRFGFWLAHAGFAIAALALATQGLSQITPAQRLNPWLLTVLAGVAGAALFVPFALAIELIFPLPPDGDDDVNTTWLSEIAGEFVAVVLPLVVAWIFLNTPRLLRLNFADVASNPTGDEGEQHPSAEEVTIPATKPDNSFLSQLPPALGTDVIAVSSDLHYLHVYTTKGKTLLLHNLKEAVAALAGQGQQVHRSHWIASRHVTRLRRRKNQLICVMSNGLEIPISRRRQKAISAQFGKDTQLAAPVNER